MDLPSADRTLPIVRQAEVFVGTYERSYDMSGLRPIQRIQMTTIDSMAMLCFFIGLFALCEILISNWRKK